MSIEKALHERSTSSCELCTTKVDLAVFEVPPTGDSSTDKAVLLCEKCRTQIDKSTTLDMNHWRCLNDSMWSQEPPVQVMAWRMLTRLSKTESWAQDLLDMLYLEGEILEWAKSMDSDSSDEADSPCLDSNGTTLLAGDTVTLIKDLDVKGANFTAKRGTTVKNISLTSNEKQVEGRVNGVKIVLVSAYLKKSN